MLANPYIPHHLGLFFWGAGAAKGTLPLKSVYEKEMASVGEIDRALEDVESPLL